MTRLNIHNYLEGTINICSDESNSIHKYLSDGHEITAQLFENEVQLVLISSWRHLARGQIVFAHVCRVEGTDG